jgi:diguanylate cyclase (GGDEF)-like protein/PAS domain S-box-containing protein
MVEIDAGGLRLPLDQLGFGFLWLRNDAELTIVSASAGFYAMLGYREGEIAALRGPGPQPVLREGPSVDWDAAGKNGFAVVELKLIKKDGHHIWVSYRMRSAVKDGKKSFWGLVDDITLTRRSHRIQREQKEELEALTANVPGGVLRCRADEFLTLDFVSEGFCRITGYSDEEISERFRSRLIEIVYPPDRGMLLERIRSGVPWDNVMEFTFRVVGRNGSVLWMMNKARCTSDSSGTVWIYSVLIDVTAMKKTQDELFASEERYRLILEHVTDPVLDCNFETKEVYYSPAFRKKFPEPLFSVEPHGIANVLRGTDFVYDADRASVLDYGRRVMCGERVQDAEFRFRSRNNAYLWCSIHPTLFRDSMGQPTRLIAVISDIDRQKKENLDLRRKAEHDLLTGLYNRVTTMTLVNDSIAHSARDDRHALFVVDIDDFKKVNDNLGHLCGDRLIAAAAGRIRSLFRGGDIVGRVGGDEFVIFMKRADSEAVLKKAETLNRTIASLSGTESAGASVSGSVGVSFYPGDGRSYDELFRKADTAMYTAKKNGKDSFRVYYRGMNFFTPSEPPLR